MIISVFSAIDYNIRGRGLQRGKSFVFVLFVMRYDPARLGVILICFHGKIRSIWLWVAIRMILVTFGVNVSSARLTNGPAAMLKA